MPSNTFITDAKIAKHGLAMFHSMPSFIKNINKQYSSEFANQGAQIGNTINVKKQNRYAVQQGPIITPQGTAEATVPLTLNRWWTIPLVVSDSERTLNINSFEQQCLKPAISKLVSIMNYECLYAAVNGVYPTANSAGSTACPGAGPVYNVIGTPGYTPGTSGGAATGLLQYNMPVMALNAGVLLDNNAAPRDGDRTLCLNSAAHAASVAGLSGLLNPSKEIDDQYRSGLMVDSMGLRLVMDQSMAAYTTGTQTSIGTVTLVDQTATCSSSSAGVATGTLTPGTSFTVAGVYAVHPETQQSTGVLMQFTVTALNTASGSAHSALAISPTPKLVGATVADGNCWTASGAFSAQTGTLTSGSAASTPYTQNLAYHGDFATLGTADLPIPSTVNGGRTMDAGRETLHGISMRVVTFWDGMSSSQITRLDVLGGFSVLRPEWAVRLSG